MDATPPVVMAVGGTDSGGGAGLAADLRSIAANGAHGVFAVSILTAQNTTRIAAVETLDPALVGAQIDTLLDDFDVRAVKTGLLFDEAIIETVVSRFTDHERLVVDPVLVRADRRPFVEPAVIEAYKSDLLPLAFVTTPNVAEAEVLTGIAITTPAAAADAAKHLVELGAKNAVVTGVLTETEAIDVHAGESGIEILRAPRVVTTNVHGTGCSFASSIAARLAHGDSADDAIESAKRYVATAIDRARDWRLGSGHGPIDHFGAASSR